MRRILITAAAGAVLALSQSAFAVDAKLAQDEMKEHGCVKCHDVAVKKVGPSLKDVAAKIRPEKILWAIRTLYKLLQEAGVGNTTVAVAALNPHGGEHGLCGTEEIEIIEPTVKRAQAEGIPAVGPYPADTSFLRARRGDFHGVVIMYHDQGQVATKLLGFDQGVTIQGGLSEVIATPAHGTAFDIAGKGVANPEAFQTAVRLAVRMAIARKGQGKAIPTMKNSQ